jgi:hypothetical protein
MGYSVFWRFLRKKKVYGKAMYEELNFKALFRALFLLQSWKKVLT